MHDKRLHRGFEAGPNARSGMACMASMLDMPKQRGHAMWLREVQEIPVQAEGRQAH